MKYVSTDDVTTILRQNVGLSTSQSWERSVTDSVLPLKDVLRWMDDNVTPNKVEYIKVQTCKYKMKRTEDGDYVISIDWSKRVD
jgi:hypothetical protein